MRVTSMVLAPLCDGEQSVKVGDICVDFSGRRRQTATSHPLFF
jgi:hypothetical protein